VVTGATACVVVVLVFEVALALALALLADGGVVAVGGTTAGGAAAVVACALGVGALVFVAPRAASSGIAYSFEDGPSSKVTASDWATAMPGDRSSIATIVDARQR
jgi:hypothetical protein